VVLERLGDIDDKNLVSAEIKDCLSDLYDNSKLRGVIFASYEKFITDTCQFALDNGHIQEIPKIELRRESDPNLYNPPNADVMELLLPHENCTPVGTILRLAWHCRLRRNEITFLLLTQVDIKTMQIVLSDGKVPLICELGLYLERLYEQNSTFSEYVLISRRKRHQWPSKAFRRLLVELWIITDITMSD